MSEAERAELKASLLAYMDEFIEKAQNSATPFDCYIADNTAALMRDAAFSVIEAVEDTQVWLNSEGYLKG